MKTGHWTGNGRSDPLSRRDLKRLGIKRRWWQKTLYQFQQDVEFPLTYHATPVRHYRPLDGLIHDYGSIPIAAQIIPAFRKDRYADSYVMHDSAYSVSHEILFSRDNEKWKQKKISREFIDHMLHDMLMCQGAELVTADLIYFFVSKFGGKAWSKNSKKP